MPLASFNTTWRLGAYSADRADFIARYENDRLLRILAEEPARNRDIHS